MQIVPRETILIPAEKDTDELTSPVGIVCKTANIEADSVHGKIPKGPRVGHSCSLIGDSGGAIFVYGKYFYKMRSVL